MSPSECPVGGLLVHIQLGDIREAKKVWVSANETKERERPDASICMHQMSKQSKHSVLSDIPHITTAPRVQPPPICTFQDNSPLIWHGPHLHNYTPLSTPMAIRSIRSNSSLPDDSVPLHLQSMMPWMTVLTVWCSTQGGKVAEKATARVIAAVGRSMGYCD